MQVGVCSLTFYLMTYSLDFPHRVRSKFLRGPRRVGSLPEQRVAIVPR